MMIALDEIEFLCYDNQSCRYEDMIEELRSTVAEQARQLQATRDTVNWLKGQYDYDESVLVGDIIHRLDANAPAPQEEKEQIHG